MDRRRFIRDAFASTLALSNLWSTADAARKLDFIRQHNADVIIVGSGPAGLAIADQLSSAGMKTLILESGRNNLDPAYQALSRVIGDLPYDLGIACPRLIGGATISWGALCPRMQETDLSGQRDYGYGVNWPISHTELARYYCAAEHWLRIGTPEPESTPAQPVCRNRRQSQFHDSSKDLVRWLGQRGIKQAYAGSAGIGRAGEYAPIRLGSVVAPRLYQRGNIKFLTNATARRIKLDKNGQVSGVMFTALDGSDGIAAGGVVVLCSGAIQNARLLLLSAEPRHPEGLGNQSGHLGRWFMEHPHQHFWIHPAIKRSPPFTGSSCVDVYHWYASLKRRGYGSMLLRLWVYAEKPAWATAAVPLGKGILLDCLCEQEPSYDNHLSLDKIESDTFGDPFPRLVYAHTKRDRSTLDEAGRLVAPLRTELGGSVVREEVASGYHHMGTTRMSDKPADGVVDENLKVHGIANLYIAGASVFCTGAAVNPTLTLTALSIRLADHLGKRQSRGEFNHLV